MHRDIKPHNVLDDGDGRVKVTDFGIARAGASQMTEAGSIVGTAQYLSPEQARGAAVDARSDLYSLGVVLYELLTGKVPFTGDSPVEIAMKHLSARPDPPSAHRPDIPRDLDLVVMRALAKDPDERYQTADEMDADLASLEQGLAVSSRTAEAETRIMSAATAIVPPAAAPARQRVSYPPPAPPPPVYYDVDEPPPRRRSLWPWLVALLLLVGAIVAGAYVYDQIQDELDQSKPVAVPLVEGMRRLLAQERIEDAGLRPVPRYEFSDDIPVGIVIVAESECRRPHRPRQPRQPARVARSRAGGGAGRPRPHVDRRRRRPHGSGPQSERPSGSLREGGGHRHGAGPAAGAQAPEGRVGSDQRFERTRGRSRCLRW